MKDKQESMPLKDRINSRIAEVTNKKATQPAPGPEKPGMSQETLDAIERECDYMREEERRAGRERESKDERAIQLGAAYEKDVITRLLVNQMSVFLRYMKESIAHSELVTVGVLGSEEAEKVHVLNKIVSSCGYGCTIVDTIGIKDGLPVKADILRYNPATYGRPSESLLIPAIRQFCNVLQRVKEAVKALNEGPQVIFVLCEGPVGSNYPLDLVTYCDISLIIEHVPPTDHWVRVVANRYPVPSPVTFRVG